jgi:hypothetical protein
VIDLPEQSFSSEFLFALNIIDQISSSTLQCVEREFEKNRLPLSEWQKLYRLLDQMNLGHVLTRIAFPSDEKSMVLIPRKQIIWECNPLVSNILNLQVASEHYQEDLKDFFLKKVVVMKDVPIVKLVSSLRKISSQGLKNPSVRDLTPEEFQDSVIWIYSSKLMLISSNGFSAEHGNEATFWILEPQNGSDSRSH